MFLHYYGWLHRISDGTSSHNPQPAVQCPLLVKAINDNLPSLGIPQTPRYQVESRSPQCKMNGTTNQKKKEKKNSALNLDVESPLAFFYFILFIYFLAFLALCLKILEQKQKKVRETFKMLKIYS